MQQIATDRAFVARACKALMVAIVALIMTLIALGNLTNYDANWQFVRHVLAMDTIFPGSRLTWRAIDSPGLQTAAYLAIIVWEVLSAAVSGVAAVRLVRHAPSTQGFHAAVPLALAGMAMVIVLFGGGFLAVGGEWFLMWQSSTWNGTESATRYFTVAALTLLVLLSPDRDDVNSD